MAMFMRKLNLIARCAGEYRTQNSSVQLPGIYHSYVFAICHRPGMSQDVLGEHLCMNKSSVTRHLTYLEQNGYVERKPSSEDKRQMLVYPTEKMLGILPEVKQVSTEWRSLLSEGIPEAELTIFHSVLERMEMRAREIVERQEEEK